MSIQPRLTGIFTPDETALQTALDIKYRRIPKKPLEGIFFEDTKKLIKLQQEEGFQTISDGQRLWGDLLRPTYCNLDEFETSAECKERKTNIKGIKIGSMTRWYETNGFCFPPRIVEKPQTSNPKINDYFFRENGEIKATQVTLPGPYTLMRTSQVERKEFQSELLNLFTDQLQLILASLPQIITLVELSEPSIVYDEKTRILPEPERKELLQQTKEAYRQLYNSTNAKILLQLPQGDLLKFPEVLDFKVDGFGVDLTETIYFSSNINLDGKVLSAGIVDAWSSFPENIDHLVHKVDLAVTRWQPGEVYLTSNSQLYHTISHQGAIQKLKDIAELARRLL